MESTLGHPVSVVSPSPRYGVDLPYRHDAFAGWRITDTESGASLRLWVTADRIVVGLHPGNGPQGWAAEVSGRLAPHVADVNQFFARRYGPGIYTLDPLGSDQPTGDFVVGRELSLAEAASSAVIDAVVDAATRAKGMVAELVGEPEVIDDDGNTETVVEDVDHLQQAADHLLIDVEELRRIKELLDNRPQVVFYGPPGTGKTYLARRLARALVADNPDRW